MNGLYGDDDGGSLDLSKKTTKNVTIYYEGFIDLGGGFGDKYNHNSIT